VISVEYLVAHYGYFALFAGAFVEGETILIAAAFAAHRGYLFLPWVVLIAFAGAFAGDQFYFFLGRKKGKVYLERRPLWQSRVKTVQNLIERYHTLIIVSFRFVYGFRSITPFALGMSDVKASRFVLLNALGAFLWAIAGGLLGNLFGAAFEALFQNVKRYEHLVLLSIFLVGVATSLLLHVGRRKRS
jgi:membrane protein DedA with SNARE-associated domain